MGHEVRVADPLGCVPILEGGRATIRYRGRPLPLPDRVLPRIGTSGTSHAIAVVRHFELMGVPTLNGADAIARAKDKLGCLQRLAARSIRVPDTLIARYPRDLKRLLKRVGGSPVVLKLLRGTQGTGVMFGEGPAAVEALLETMWSLGEDVLIQRFVTESKGRDVRTLVVGGRVRAAMRRIAREGEFRSNLHRGGSGEQIRLSKAMERAAVRAVKAIGLDAAGVDLLESEQGRQVIEVNASPGFEGLEATTGTNVAGLLVKAAIRAR